MKHSEDEVRAHAVTRYVIRPPKWRGPEIIAAYTRRCKRCYMSVGDSIAWVTLNRRKCKPCLGCGRPLPPTHHATQMTESERRNAPRRTQTHKDQACALSEKQEATVKQSQSAARAQAIPQTVARPWAKWAGGKTALLPQILPRLPQKIGTYYEPFIGGGAVFFALAAEGRFEHAIISDTNDELIRTYTGVAYYLGDTIALLSALKYDETEYYRVRALDPNRLEPAALAARFIYLNRCGFNGLYRVNKSGKFNVPFGRYTNPTICDEVNLRAAAAVIRSTLPVTGDFEHVVQTAKKGDAVYFDPPYWPASESANFTSYTKDGFGSDDQRRLRDCALRLKKRGVHVLLSNADVAPVRALYKGFKIERVEAPRRINSKGGKRGNVGELLISGRNT